MILNYGSTLPLALGLFSLLLHLSSAVGLYNGIVLLYKIPVKYLSLTIPRWCLVVESFNSRTIFVNGKLWQFFPSEQTTTRPGWVHLCVSYFLTTMSRQPALLRKRRDLGGFHILELRLATKEQTCYTNEFCSGIAGLRCCEFCSY